jgi:phosphoribosyl 1,2-cyclic phosphodiesterase
MRFAVLGSGSGGNASVIEAGGVLVLVDAGLSAKQLVLRMRGLGIEPERIGAVLLTHEHGDHIRGLRVLLKQISAPVFTTPQTAQVVRETGVVAGVWKLFEAGQDFRVGGLEVGTFPIQHDAVDPVGFVFRHGEAGLGMVSDAGHVTSGLSMRLRGLHGLFLEANYDEQMLEADVKRPWGTKQRISSRHGHLSNSQTAALVADVAHEGLRRVVLGHLSRDCNAPDVALRAVRTRLAEHGWNGVSVHCACQDEASPWWTLG